MIRDEGRGTKILMYTRFNWNRDGYEKNEIIYYAINFEIGLKSTIFRSLYFIEKFSNYISLIILAYYSSHSYFSKRNQRVSNNYIALLFHRRTTRGRFFSRWKKEKKRRKKREGTKRNKHPNWIKHRNNRNFGRRFPLF